MLTYAASLEAVEKAIATDQIGTPVAVRAVAHVVSDHGQVESLLSTTITAAASWLDASFESLQALGGIDRGQVTVLAKFAGGKTALVSAGVRGVGTPLLELLVFGGSGVMSWEGAVAGRYESGDESSADLAIARAVRASLEAKSPVNATGQPLGRVNSSDTPRVRVADSVTPTRQSPPYGVLLVSGYHTHQPGYAADLAADPRCHIVGLTDEADLPERRESLNRRLATEMQVPYFDDMHAAIQREDVDIVSVCAEPYRRGNIVVAAARAGKHLYLDKPLAGSLADADAITDSVREARVVGHMFSQIHGEPATTARRVVESGELGDLVAVHYDLTFAKGQAGMADLSKPRVETPQPDRFELLDSKRELTNIGVYPLCMLFWLLQKEITSVYASTGNFFFAEHQQNNMEDFGQMLVEFEGGVTGTITAGRAGWRSHRDYGIHRVCLIGTQRTAVVDAHRPRVEVWADVEPWTAPQPDPTDPMGMWAPLPDSPFRARPKLDWTAALPGSGTSDVQHFLDCIEQGRQSDIPVEIAAASTEALMAAYRSAAADELVELPLAR